jgi:SHS2 domain-containing protein
MAGGTFAEIEHTADLGLDLAGPTPAAVLEAALSGLVHVLFGGEPPRPAPESERRVELRADSWPELLKAWLEALYRPIEEEGLVPVAARFEAVAPDDLRAVVSGAPVPREMLAQASELKAVTWHELAFEPADAGWRARVIFDV